MLNATANEQTGMTNLTDCVEKYYLSSTGIPVTSGEIVKMRAELISQGTDKFARFMTKTIEGEGKFRTNCAFEGSVLGGSPIRITMTAYMEEDDHLNDDDEVLPTDPSVEMEEAMTAMEEALGSDIGEGEVEWPDEPDPEPEPDTPPAPEPPEKLNKYNLFRQYNCIWTQQRDGVSYNTFSPIYEDTNVPDIIITMVADIFEIVNLLLECEFIEITKEQYDAAVEAAALLNKSYSSSCPNCSTKNCKECSFSCKAEIFSDMENAYLCSMCNSRHEGIRYYHEGKVFCPRCTYSLIISEYSTITGTIDLCSHHTCLCMPDEMLTAVVDQIIETYHLPIQKVLGKS